MLRHVVSTSDDYTLTILRLAAGVVFFAHGAGKLAGWWGGVGFMATMGYFERYLHIPGPFAFLAICAEFFGGLGLLLGFLTRIAAFGLICDMFVALFKVHALNGFFMNWQGTKHGEGFEFHIIALALLFALLVRGAGALSFDGLFGRTKPAGQAGSMESA